MLLQSKGHGRSLEHLFFTFRKLLMFASAYSKIDNEIHKKRQMHLTITNLKISVEWICERELSFSPYRCEKNPHGSKVCVYNWQRTSPSQDHQLKWLWGSRKHLINEEKPGTKRSKVRHAGGFPDSSVGKESACIAGDPTLIPGSGRSPGEAKGYPLQYSGLENSIDNALGSQRVRHDWATFTFKAC